VSPQTANPKITKRSGSANPQIATLAEGPILVGKFADLRYAELICGLPTYGKGQCRLDSTPILATNTARMTISLSSPLVFLRIVLQLCAKKFLKFFP
jgi:hypothetical protein